MCKTLSLKDLIRYNQIQYKRRAEKQRIAAVKAKIKEKENCVIEACRQAEEES